MGKALFEACWSSSHYEGMIIAKAASVIHKQLPLDETHLDMVRGFIELRGFHPSAATIGARRSDAATSDKDKQICFMLMPST